MADKGEEIDLGTVSGALTDAQREEFIKQALAAKGISGSPGLVQLMQDKLDRLVGKSSGYLESLPKKVKNRVENLKKIQEEHDELEDQYLKEKAELEARYNAKYAPLYEKRAAIVSGDLEPEELPPKEGEEEKEEKEEATSSEQKEEEDVKGVPNFWLTALRNNPTIEETISEKDEGALEYLRDIKWHPMEEQKGFTLEFYFAPNPYFSNTLLKKSYYMVEDVEPILESAEGTDIEWLPGKNLTQKVLRKKPKKGAKNAKPVTKTEQVESFFNFFSPPTIPDDMDEQEAEELQNLMEADFDVGSALKEKIIPHAVDWFTGEAVDLEDDFDEDDLDEDDLEEEDEEDEDDEDEDEDDVPQRGRRQAAKRAHPAPTGKPGQQPPECKQQ